MTETVINECAVSWLIPTDFTVDPFPRQLLRRTLLLDRPPIRWSFYETTEATDAECFALGSGFREEVKACLRKRSRIKGNVASPLAIFLERQIPFTVHILRFPSGDVFLHLTTKTIKHPLSPEQLADLSTQPTNPSSQFHWCIHKVLAVLAGQDIRSRRPPPFEFHFYPQIHLRLISTSRRAKGTASLPWNDLAVIGTRHLHLEEEDVSLVSRYRDKNLSFREKEVAVVDKQSTLLMSPQDRYEHMGFEYCLIVALRLRRLLENAFRSQHPYAVRSIAPLAERILFSAESPSVVTDSINYQKFWPQVLGELQAVTWARNCMKKVSAPTGGDADIGRLVKQIQELESQVGSLTTSIQKLNDLVRTNFGSALNYVRQVLEEVVGDIFRRSKSSNLRPKEESLSSWIDLLSRDSVIPDDVAACMNLIRDYGNIGSHPGKVVFNPTDSAITLVLSALAQVFEWYVHTFLPRYQCRGCGHRLDGRTLFCTKCGARAQSDERRQCKCDFRYDETTRFCPLCGIMLKPTVVLGDA